MKSLPGAFVWLESSPAHSPLITCLTILLTWRPNWTRGFTAFIRFSKDPGIQRIQESQVFRKLRSIFGLSTRYQIKSSGVVPAAPRNYVKLQLTCPEREMNSALTSPGGKTRIFPKAKKRGDSRLRLLHQPTVICLTKQKTPRHTEHSCVR